MNAVYLRGLLMLGSKRREQARDMAAQIEELRAQATLWGDWSSGQSFQTWSGQDVSKATALQLLAVYGSVRMISDGISTMPIDLYRRQAGGTAEEVEAPRWLLEPAIGLSFTEWCSQVLTSLLLDGNSYNVVSRDARGQIVELVPVANETVAVRWEGTKKAYTIGGINFTGEVMHVKGMMLAGSLVGLSPVEYARQTIGLGLAAQKYGSQWFDGPGNMPGVLEAPRPMQPEMMTATAKAWQKFRQQGGQGLPGVTQDGMVFKPIGVTNEQAQFLETRQWSAAEIAGQMFLLDPSDLGIPVSGTSLTYGNLEQRDSRRVKVAYLPWMIRVEKALNALMMSSTDYIKFNPDGLLRADLLARYQSYEIAAAAGVLTINEIRELEDQPPLSADDRKHSRAWAEVGLPALVTDGLMTVNEARAQLGLPPVAGGDKPRDPATGGSSPQANSVVLHGEQRDETYVVTPNITVHVPKHDINVTAPAVSVAAPNVTLEAPRAPKVTARTVERDDNGRITRIVEEG